MLSFSAALLTLALSGAGDAVLLDFYSDTCGPCRQMDPVVQSLTVKGYPVRKVNVAHEPGLASRFGVTQIPCFVMVVDGREVDRTVGTTNSGRLEQMLAAAQRPAAGAAAIHLVNNERSGGASIPIPAMKTNASFTAGPQEGTMAAPLASNRPERERPSDVVDRLGNDLIAATVRLRIEDSTGHSCGTGTIIDARQGEALVLTCGHIFRESQGKGRIDVDLFGPTPAERIPGRLIHYDLDRDLGLLSIRIPGSVNVARVAPPGHPVGKGSRVISVGCNNGDMPTARASQITAQNKFLGPENFTVSGLPVQGRSGGGLFSTDGMIVGVCNAAVPTDNEGMYAALRSIHEVLDRAKLSQIYQKPATESALVAADVPNLPKRMPPQSDMRTLTEAVQPSNPGPAVASGPAGNPPPVGNPFAGQPAMVPTAATIPAAPGSMRDDERAALEEIQRRRAEGAEVVCVIRSRNNPQSPSEIIVIEKATPAFLQSLTPPKQ